MSTPPHDLVAEENLLGSMIVRRESIEYAADQVTPDDFYSPTHQAAFAAIIELWKNGDPVDPTSLADVLGQGLRPEVTRWYTEVPLSTSVAKYAAIVVDHAARRELLRVVNLASLAVSQNADPADIADRLSADLAAVDLPAGRVPANLWTLDEFRRQGDDALAPWVVPGLLRKGWRAITVAAEGVGKSLIAQQVAMAAAGGVHPFNGKPIEPVSTLLVDLENDAHRIIDGTSLIDETLSLRRKVDGGVWLWHEPGGINLRQRKDRTSFEAVLAHCRPQLVCLGPIYKAYEAKVNESFEQVASEVQKVFDKLRTRYGFALLLEHHAPQGESKNVRELRPYGSSLWLRWPEFGLSLEEDTDPARKGSLKVKRWRKDRVKGEWPDRLDRGGPGSLPWVGYWSNGGQF